MSDTKKSTTEEVLDKLENQPTQDEWMAIKGCFNKLTDELNQLTKKYPSETKIRKVPDVPNVPNAPNRGEITKDVQRVINLLERAPVIEPNLRTKAEAAKREFSDMLDCLNHFRQIEKQGKHSTTINVSGSKQMTAEEQQSKIDKFFPDKNNPNMTRDDMSATTPSKPKALPKGSDFAKTFQPSLKCDEIKKDEKQHDKVSVEGGEKKIDGSKTGTNKNEDPQKEIPDSEARIKNMEKEKKELEKEKKELEKEKKELAEKVDVSEKRIKKLEEETNNLKRFNQEIVSRVKTLQEENKLLESRLSQSENESRQMQAMMENQILVLDSQNHDLRLRLNNSESRNAAVEHENKNLKEQVDELTMRLSSFASKQLSEGNPNVADLSDQNRPTKIGEKFGSLYDDEWSEAFDVLSNTDMSEDDAIKYLIDIIQISYTFCTQTAKQQLDKLNEKMKSLMIEFEYEDADGKTTVQSSPPDQKVNVDSTRAKYAKDYRKAVANESILGICKMLRERKLKEHLDKFAGEEERNILTAYIDRCTELIWYMVVQDPPMLFEIPEPGTQFNTNAFKHYKKKGKIVKLAVWPAVKLCEDGGLISKGYALPE